MKHTSRGVVRGLLAVFGFLPLTVGLGRAQTFACDPDRIATAWDGSEPNEYTSHPALSRDG